MLKLYFTDFQCIFSVCFVFNSSLKWIILIQMLMQPCVSRRPGVTPMSPPLCSALAHPVGPVMGRATQFPHVPDVFNHQSLSHPPHSSHLGTNDHFGNAWIKRDLFQPTPASLSLFLSTHTDHLNLHHVSSTLLYSMSVLSHGAGQHCVCSAGPESWADNVWCSVRCWLEHFEDLDHDLSL